MSTVPQAEAGAATRGNPLKIVGTVTSNAMDKTVVVTVIRRVRDRRFHKFVSRRVKYKAHDPNNEYQVGDKVEIEETRPLSREKRWQVTRLIERIG